MDRVSDRLEAQAWMVRKMADSLKEAVAEGAVTDLDEAIRWTDDWATAVQDLVKVNS